MSQPLGAIALVLGAALATAFLIVLSAPLLRRYALARPNARSSHVTPTPQGAGAAVILVTIVGSVLAVAITGAPVGGIVVLFVAAAALAIVGAIDDIRVLDAFPRLVVQLAAAVTAVIALPDALRILDPLPFLLERVILTFAIVWFVNLVNFMDGIDWITVAEVVPLTAALAVLGALGEVPEVVSIVALVLGGSMLGFSPFNRPVASVFLGDVGSLPIGLVIAWMLIVTAGSGHLAVAILLPLYYLADSTITLAKRLARKERVWQAHRTHYYQRATTKGFTVLSIVTRVFVVNLLLGVIAIATVLLHSVAADLAGIFAGGAVVAGFLRQLSRGRA